MADSGRRRAVVVGGGVGGLSAGILLAEGGYDTTIVEQHDVLGGYQQGFVRRGVSFEVGHHYIGGCLPGEAFARYLRLLGIYDDLQPLPARDDAVFRIVLPDGTRADLPRGMDRLAAELKRAHPREAEGIDALLGKIEECVDASPWHGMKRRQPVYEIHEKYSSVSARDVIESHVSSPALRETLSSFCFSTTMFPDQCPFAIYAHIFHLLVSSVSRMRGGGRSLVEAMERRFRSLGGAVILGRGAERLVTENRLGRSLILADGTELNFDIALFTCHPFEAVRVCGRENFSPVFLENLDSMEQGRGSFKAYVETDGPVASLGGDHCMIMSADRRWAPGVYISSPSASDPSRGGHTVEILCWQDFEEVERWVNSKPGGRPKEYLEFKERRARELLGLADREFPGIIRSVRHVWTSTPLTNLRYTRSVRGAAMGVSHSIAFQGRRQMRPRNRLRNVFFGGQSVGLPGVAGTIITSAAICNVLLDGADLLGRILEMRD